MTWSHTCITVCFLLIYCWLLTKMPVIYCMGWSLRLLKQSGKTYLKYCCEQSELKCCIYFVKNQVMWYSSYTDFWEKYGSLRLINQNVPIFQTPVIVEVSFLDFLLNSKDYFTTIPNCVFNPLFMNYLNCNVTQRTPFILSI